MSIFETENKEKIIDLNNYIEKKLAAIEVYKWLGQLKLVSVMSITGFVTTLLAYSFSGPAGLIAAVMFCFGSIYFMFRSVQEMKRLEFTYKLEPSKPIFQFKKP